MSKTNDKFEKKRLRSSNITVVISISLVLFLLGIFGLIVINAQSYAEHLKRELKIEAYFKDVEDPKLKDKELDLQKSYIDSLKVKYPFVEATQYISKEDASVHDVLLCIQTGKVVTDQDRMRFLGGEFYLKSEAEMRAYSRAIPKLPTTV